MVLEGLGLGDKPCYDPFAITEFCLRNGFIIDLAAIQASVVSGKLRAGDLGIIVTPEGFGLIPFNPYVKSALGFDIAHQGGVIAVNRVVFIRIKITEDTLGVFFSESLAYILYLPLFRIQG